MEASTKKNRNIWGSRVPGAGGRGVGHAVSSDTMKFGWMTLSLSPSAADDLASVHQQLEQGVLAEAMGFDYLWLTEHNFTGECAYADPIPFAGEVVLGEPEEIGRAHV